MLETRAEHGKTHARGRRRRIIFWGSLGLATAVLFATGWIGVRGMLAAAALEEAVPLAAAITYQIIDGDRAATEKTFTDLFSRTTEAEPLTGDPIWRAAEIIPLLGSNLFAVREAAAIVDEVARDGIAPFVSLSGELSVNDF